MRHKWAEVIHAYANGEIIEVKSCDGIWREARYPTFFEDTQYRIKPEKKPDVVRWLWANDIMGENHEISKFDKNSRANLKIVFDGETGKLKSAEVLNANT